ncbi:pah4 homeobox protein encoded by the pah4 protein [Podospora australis]|uniref:Pah4 homeobox protein encoded by the pah4 protein n=1 Tax=Podospora australis TaxID=1536484 RepID=A0AAN7AQ22_9PEZI|nr:pah4 homeobox protein encoded by the pah4 protein [Podospora australis]
MEQAPSPPRASSPSPPARAQSPTTSDDGQPSSPTTHNALLPSIPPQSSPEQTLDPSGSSGAATSEGERHPKGKRKRTAAKDKAILEAAYIANPKPDKAARLEIVKRVSLNEKEVQIWFQNRRQNDRRKSRPLSPQEIAALRYGGMQILSSDPAPLTSSFSSDHTNTSPVQHTPTPRQEPQPTSPIRSDPPVFHAAEEPEKIQEMPREVRTWETPAAISKELVTPAPKERTTQRTMTEEQTPSLSRSFSASVGYISNRWNPGNSFTTPLNRDENGHHRLESFSSSCPPLFNAGILPPPSSQSSRFRISLSLEGKAEVVASAVSPPRPAPIPPTPDMLQSLNPIRRPSLHRSHSASSSVTLPPFSVLTNSLTNPSPLPPRLTRGRSRDVHAWEFCCDAENREDALTAQAKHESSGSAIAAISLLRSTSSTGGSPLQPSSSAKRNATMSKVAPRSGTAKKAKLARTTSSISMTEGSFGDSNKRMKIHASSYSPSGHDSDKENWSPDEDGNPRTPYYSHSHTIMSSATRPTGRRPLPSSASRLDGDRKNPRRTPGTARSVLNGNRSSSFLNNRANTAPVKGWGGSQRRDKQVAHGSPLDIFEDDEDRTPSSNRRRPALDDEVERFMRGDVSPSKKGDVDAVAGLLSLSQGNWR